MRFVTLTVEAIAIYWPALLLALVVAGAVATGRGVPAPLRGRLRRGRLALGNAQWLVVPALFWALLANLRLIAFFDSGAPLADAWHGFAVVLLSFVLLVVLMMIPLRRGVRGPAQPRHGRLFRYPRPVVAIVPPMVVLLEWGVALGMMTSM